MQDNVAKIRENIEKKICRKVSGYRKCYNSASCWRTYSYRGCSWSWVRPHLRRLLLSRWMRVFAYTVYTRHASNGYYWNQYI